MYVGTQLERLFTEVRSVKNPDVVNYALFQSKCIENRCSSRAVLELMGCHNSGF
jgi:hypothetical protein